MIDTARSRILWRVATVKEVRSEVTGVATFVLEVPGWPGHAAGQHLDLRLTAPDGYQAQRSYSIASAPGGTLIAITVSRVPDGEVSPFMLDDAVEGDQLEVRGPVGGYFSWKPGAGRPLLLVAGGSGIVPLMAMLRHRAAVGDANPAQLLYSSRSYGSIIFRDEIKELAARGDGFDVTHTLTRELPPGWAGASGRIDRAMLGLVAFTASAEPFAFICGPTSMVDQAAADLVALGYNEAWVKTERFGPTGDAK